MVIACRCTSALAAGPPEYASGSATKQTLQGDIRLSEGIPFTWTVNGVLDCYNFEAEQKAQKNESSAAAMLMMRVATVVARPDAKVTATLKVPPLTAEILNQSSRNRLGGDKPFEVSRIDVTLFTVVGSQIMTYSPDADYLRKKFPSTPAPLETKHQLAAEGGKVSCQIPTLGAADLARFNQFHWNRQVVNVAGYVSAAATYHYKVIPEDHVRTFPARTELIIKLLPDPPGTEGEDTLKLGDAPNLMAVFDPLAIEVFAGGDPKPVVCRVAHNPEADENPVQIHPAEADEGNIVARQTGSPRVLSHGVQLFPFEVSASGGAVLGAHPVSVRIHQEGDQTAATF